jgi:hypothetical protein
MLTKTLMPFLLNIILLAGVHEGHANQRRFDSDQYNIARSQILDTRTHRKGVRDIIRSILDKRKRNNIPPAIEQKIQYQDLIANTQGLDVTYNTLPFCA